MKPIIDPAWLETVYLKRMTMSQKERVYAPRKTKMELLCGDDRQAEAKAIRESLGCAAWQKSDGAGILDQAFRAVSAVKTYQSILQYHESALRKSTGKMAEALYMLFRENQDAKAFDQMMLALHRIRMNHRLMLPAYFFFLKDPAVYAPYGESMFFASLRALNIRREFEESWQGYTDYLGMLRQVRDFLQSRVAEKATMAQAYGFVYHAWRQRQDTPEWDGQW